MMNERSDIEKKFHAMKEDLLTRLQNACSQRDEARTQVLELQAELEKSKEQLLTKERQLQVASATAGEESKQARHMIGLNILILTPTLFSPPQLQLPLSLLHLLLLELQGWALLHWRNWERSWRKRALAPSPTGLACWQVWDPLPPPLLLLGWTNTATPEARKCCRLRVAVPLSQRLTVA
jgi:hypothetical protein